MPAEDIKKILDALTADPKTQELLKARPEPASAEEAIRAYAEIAAELGFDVTESDLQSYLEKTEKMCKARTEATASRIELLDDDVLDQVAGGKDHDSCKDTYKDKENCWFNDGCDHIYHSYSDYICHIGYWGKACHEPSSPCNYDMNCDYGYTRA